MSCRCVILESGSNYLLTARAQAWRSDEQQDDWEPERAAITSQVGSQAVRLRGPGGIVDIVVISVLGDLMQPLPPCSAAECCEMDNDAALEVR